ncbi:hypothetical protein FRC17_008538 [Serendipita sp. 399]|nr:hypothetical protein FRC17_008538 [Serendipita sp. 399]
MGHSPLKHWPDSQTTAAARDTMAATPEAIITISFYSQPIKISNRNEALVNGYVLDTICALEASQTLQTVFEQLPCADEDKSVEWTSVTSHKIKEPEEELYGMVLDHTAVGGGTGKWAQ